MAGQSRRGLFVFLFNRPVDGPCARRQPWPERAGVFQPADVLDAAWARVCHAGCQADSGLSARRAKARPRRRRKRHKAYAGRRGPAAVGGPFGRRYPAGPCRKQRAGQGPAQPCPKQPASPAKGRPLSGCVSDGGPVPAWAGTSYPAGVHHCLCAFGPNRKPRISAVHCPNGPGACFDGAGVSVSLWLSGRQGCARPAAGTAQAGRCRRRCPCAGKRPRAAQTVFAVSQSFVPGGVPGPFAGGLHRAVCDKGPAGPCRSPASPGRPGAFGRGLSGLFCGRPVLGQLFRHQPCAAHLPFRRRAALHGLQRQHGRARGIFLPAFTAGTRSGGQARAAHTGPLFENHAKTHMAAAKRARWPACCGCPAPFRRRRNRPCCTFWHSRRPRPAGKKANRPPPAGAAYQTRPAAFPAAGHIFSLKTMFICFS